VRRSVVFPVPISPVRRMNPLCSWTPYRSWARPSR
jgi:hypothetical protein